jgi:hypothetical protein
MEGTEMAERSTNPTPGEIVIMAAGAVALIFSFFHFYSTPSSTVGNITVGGGGVSAWGKGLFPVATLMVLLVVIMAAQIALTKFAHVDLGARPLGFTWEQIHLVLGFFAALLAVCWLVTSKRGLDFGIGFWFILIACIAALVGAILLWRERVGTHPDSPAT